MAITTDPPTTSQLADFSVADHEFTLPGTGYARQIRIYTPGGLTTPTLAYRMLNNAADDSIPLVEGVEVLPGAITHIRNAGTTAGVNVRGYS